MLWSITILTFLATIAIAGALLYAFTPSELGIAGRLSRLFNIAAPAEEKTFVQEQKGRALDTLKSIGRLTSSPKSITSKGQLLMIRAGYRSSDAMWAMRGAKILLPIGFAGLVFVTGLYRLNPFLVFAVALLAGYLLPDMWLVWRVSRRQHRLRKGLPDALDLLVICVEAGLGLDQALLRVAEELRITHPELCEELQLVNLEMRVGKTRIEALRELAKRTGLDDIKALVSMLIQTERFGTSIAQSLRVHSDDLRMKRRQRAEEKAAKMSVKMVPVLVFFIFPALMVVILGPAVLQIMRQLMPIL
jgi:tight adherence protein C